MVADEAYINIQQREAQTKVINIGQRAGQSLLATAEAGVGSGQGTGVSAALRS